LDVADWVVERRSERRNESALEGGEDWMFEEDERRVNDEGEKAKESPLDESDDRTPRVDWIAIRDSSSRPCSSLKEEGLIEFAG